MYITESRSKSFVIVSLVYVLTTFFTWAAGLSALLRGMKVEDALI